MAERRGDVVIDVEGHLGTITLDRPQAINALTLRMVREIARALDMWDDDTSVAAVMIMGAGPRGLCAGGDLIALHDSARAGGADARRFWREEYEINARIARYGKPVVAIMDGIVMGGGVGLSGHASHRVATERLVWAMPEVRIGSCPDVGGTFLLSRAPGELGLHLALTASRIGAGDAIACGFADTYVASAGLALLRADLQSGDIAAAIARASALSDRPPESTLLPQREVIDNCYRYATAGEIITALKAKGHPLAQAAVEAMAAASPTSLEVALQALRRARELTSLEDCLAQEYRVNCRFLEIPDFVEGIRAAVIDKDRRPRWTPSTLAEVRSQDIDAFFESPAGSGT